MLVSMTGFGRSESKEGVRKLSVELKSVNNRFLDISLRCPRDLNSLEEKIRQTISGFARRGRIDCSVSYQYSGEDAYEIQVNLPLALAYQKGAAVLAEASALQETVTLSQLLTLPDVVRVERRNEDVAVIWQELELLLRQALSEFAAMRAQEGLRLEEDFRLRLMMIQTMSQSILERAPLVVAEYSQKLQAKMLELLNGVQVEETRLLTEVAMMANRSDITEELVRLASHVQQFYQLLDDKTEPVGKKLDFLLQEMNREVNTIGSKASDFEIGKNVVNLKAELEKMREQIQNIE
ncbi:MAG: YicC family protein [Negativicutes bacterium]|nr:YicC family protein [Negativicutes bacterium]